MSNPQVLKHTPLSIQICVPKGWTNKQVKEFADQKVLCGTSNGWTIRKEGDPALKGDPERRKCESDPEYVHIVLDA